MNVDDGGIVGSIDIEANVDGQIILRVTNINIKDDDNYEWSYNNPQCNACCSVYV